MSPEEARRLLELSRRARWAFPTSFGRPIGAEVPDWLEELADERGSFAEAARQLPDDEAMELAANVWRVFVFARDIDAGRAFLGEILERGAEASRFRALALYGDSLLAARQGAHADARARNEQARELARALGDAEALTLAHLGLGRVAFDGDGDFARALEHALQAREHARGLGEEYDQAPLGLHAQSVRMLRRYDEAASLSEQDLELNRRIGDDGMVLVTLHNLGFVELHRGNVDAAERYFAESGAAEDDPYAHLSAAAIAAARGDDDRARELVERVEQAIDPSELPNEDRFELETLRAQLYPLR